MGKYLDAERLESDGWTMSRTRPLSHTEMLYETRKPTDFPEAEVVEIKHGRWIDINDTIISGICSVCGWQSIWQKSDVVGMNYCPNCGAQMMDGDKE